MVWIVKRPWPKRRVSLHHSSISKAPLLATDKVSLLVSQQTHYLHFRHWLSQLKKPNALASAADVTR
jgi:hypothetical protein